MNNHIKNLIFIIICLVLILFWIWKGITNNLQEEITNEEIIDNSNLLFEFMDRSYPKNISDLTALSGTSSISYKDSSNYMNILQNLTTHEITIGEISPKNTYEFLSISYSNHIQSFLKKNNSLVIENWDSIKSHLEFNINELGIYGECNEIGFFKTNNETLYYLKSNTPSKAESLLSLTRDSSITLTLDTSSLEEKKIIIYKLSRNNLFYLLIGNLFSEKYNNSISTSEQYYININRYFVFSDNIGSLKSIYESFYKNNTLTRKTSYTNFVNQQFSNYSLNYYYDATSDFKENSDSLQKNIILTYQLRGEKNSILTYLNILYTDFEGEINNINVDNNQEEISIKEEQTKIENQDSEEIKYVVQEGDSFRDATIKLKKELEKHGYEYDKVKSEYILFYINNGSKVLDWNIAVSEYLDKKIPKAGDYFLMKKLY